MTHNAGLFIFRRDLRQIDNIGLMEMSKKCKKLYGIFILTPEQITTNAYKSSRAINFMIESLMEIDNLTIFYGDNIKIIESIIKHANIDIVGTNRDFTPYAQKRDAELLKLCEKNKVVCNLYDDYYLLQMGSITTDGGKPYQKYTPFYNKFAKELKKIAPPSHKQINIIRLDATGIGGVVKNVEKYMTDAKILGGESIIHGGRSNAIKQLTASLKTQSNYNKTRNDLTYTTSMLSAYIKFGCISIREVYDKTHGNRDFVKQLIWREFYANIMYSFPHVIGNPLKDAYGRIKWDDDAKYFTAWKDGKTGYPVVDAGMRQLNTTGFMHNRARLITASFLVKVLLIDWQKGERYFAQRLIDYDPSANNGNWQWVAGSGADSQPYFRIFNPWLQTENYDPEVVYIKKYIPELAEVPAKDILKWYDTHSKYPQIKYPSPIVDYTTRKEYVLKKYKAMY